MFMFVHVSADQFLLLAVRAIPEENLNNTKFLPAFYPKFKFSHNTSRIFNAYFLKVFLCSGIKSSFCFSLKGYLDLQEFSTHP